MPLALYVAGVAFACVAIASRYLNGRKDLPPGPPGHWLWGNEFPQSNDFLKYHEWGQLYGPIYSLRSGLRTIIVICGFEPAVQILEKEGAVTADRPRMVAGGEIRSGGMRLLLIGVGERLKELRRALHQHLQSRAAVRYEDTQQFNARQLIRDILDEPGAIDEHAKRYAISTILSITYGQASPCDMSDPDIPLLYSLLYDLGQATRPGTWAVDQFPWLKFIPFYGRPLREQHRRELNLFRKQLQNVRTAMMVGGSGTSFGAYLLQNQKELSLSDNEIAYLAGSMFGAGSDTSAAGIRVVIMAAACFPEAQSEVQKELDTVLGHDRLPTIADLSLLPRTRAFVLETFRWRPGTAAGTQHRAMQDIHWRGYKIPAGATIIPNHWSIGRDLDFWPDGDSFVPDRWLDSTGQVVEKPAFPNFGFGRRVCPGQPVAERSMFINAAMLMQSFTISQDPSQPIDTMSFKHGVITQPAPFTAKFAVRNPGGLNTLKTMLQEL